VSPPTPIQRLYQRAPMGMRLGLEPMLAACAAAGHPERALSTVHVAGTNGKGSVSAMVERIAREAGMRTGLYTSPHLCRFAERIRIDGEPIDDAALDRHLDEALRVGDQLSFFETATLAAFLALRDAKVDLAIVEVGLGGRLDATNVIPAPRAAAITRIALDHTELLGGTLELIAQEKAAIAKPGLDLVLGPIAGTVRDAIAEVARAAGATISMAEDDDEARRFAASSPRVGLAGDHQLDNAKIAFVLGRRIGADADACARGIANVSWPGRLETIHAEDGEVLLDAAHNPDGAEALARNLAGRDPGATALLFGTLADKAWPEMIDRLAPRARHRVYVAPKGRAATDPSVIAERQPGEVAADVASGYAQARAMVGERGLVVACGSVYLAGELRALLLSLPRDPPIAL
jgi:dihydrofolate synthase/folylpolyglutamate synthase